MTRPRRPKSVAAQPSPTNTDIKTHPVFIAASSVAGTVLLCIAVVTQVVMPTQVAKLDIEILKLKDSSKELQQKISAQATVISRQSTEIKNLTKKDAQSSASIKALEQQVFDAKLGNLFTGESPYPNGLGMVHIGMPMTAVAKNYPAEFVHPDKETPGLITVDVKNSPIQGIAYYYDEKSKEKRITHVGFSIDIFKGYPEGFLYKKVVEAFGEPDAHPRSRYYAWNVNKTTNIFMHSEHSFLVMQKGYRPILWPGDE